MGSSPEAALEGIRLVMLANDVSLRNLIPAELAKGFGFFQSKPATAFSPVAVTPDELGDAWRGGRVHLDLESVWNGKRVGPVRRRRGDDLPLRPADRAHLQDAQRARRLDRRQRHGQQQGLGARLLLHRREARDRDDRGRRAEDAVHAVRRHDPHRDEGRRRPEPCSARSSRRSPRWRRDERRAAAAASSSRPSGCCSGTLVFLGFQWYEREERRTTLLGRAAASIEIRRAADGHYHWPGRINGRPVEFLIDTGASGAAIPGGAGDPARPGGGGPGAIAHRGRRRHRPGGARRPRARRRGARRAAAHGRAASAGASRCSAWTCSGGCAGSSKTGPCASTWARRPGRVKLLP